MRHQKSKRLRKNFALFLTLGAAMTAINTNQVQAQCPPIHVITPPAGASNFGRAVVRLDDVNSDGVFDLAVGAIMSGGGSVFIYSGLDAALIRALQGPSEFGTRLADAGDVNGDGIGDVLVGEPNAGRVTVFSGVDGLVLHEITSRNDDSHGYAINRLGDVDRDGHDDFAVGAPRFSPTPQLSQAGRVTVYSGSSGLELYHLDGMQHDHQFGASLAPLADLNDDGWDDLAIGSLDPLDLPSITAQVFICSGQSGSIITAIPEPAPQLAFGYKLAGMPDIDGDNVRDLVVDAPSAGERVVYFYSGARGTLIDQIAISLSTIKDGPEEGLLLEYNTAVAGGDDVNGDGHPDALIGDGRFSPRGRAYTFSGTDRTLIERYYGTNQASQDYFGATVTVWVTLSWAPAPRAAADACSYFREVAPAT
jgi:hypothetical protein